MGYQSKSTAGRRNNVVERPKKMSFKQRRDLVKEQSAGKQDLKSTQDNVENLRKSAGHGSSLERMRAKVSGSNSLSSRRDQRTN